VGTTFNTKVRAASGERLAVVGSDFFADEVKDKLRFRWFIPIVEGKSSQAATTATEAQALARRAGGRGIGKATPGLDAASAPPSAPGRGLAVKFELQKSWLGPGPDGERNVLFGAVYVPYEPDGYKDWADERNIFDACNYYAESGANLSVEHTRQCVHCRHIVPPPPADTPDACPKCGSKWQPRTYEPGEATAVQNYTADVTFVVGKDGKARPFVDRKDVKKGEQVIPAGTWILGAKLRGEALQDAQSGTTLGWSFEGRSRAAFDNRARSA
jgi:hypothetical protein